MNAGYEIPAYVKVIITVCAVVGLFVIAVYPKLAGWIRSLFSRKD